MYKTINDIKAEEVDRMTSRDPEFDWIMGKTLVNGKMKWGTPISKVILLAGEGGVGKSRFAINFSKDLLTSNNKVLFFQNEVDLEEMAGWVHGCHHPGNFYCSNEESMEEQIKVIREVKPTVVFVDSVNNLDEYGNGATSNIKHVINTYKNIGREMNCPIFLLTQLNQDGSVKGGSTLTHLPDVVLLVENLNRDEGLFTIRVGNKHRCGRTGSQFTTTWKHFDNGVACVSDNRMRDRIYLGREPEVEVEEVEFEQEFVDLSSAPARETPWGAEEVYTQAEFDALCEGDKNIYATYGVKEISELTEWQFNHLLKTKHPETYKEKVYAEKHGRQYGAERTVGQKLYDHWFGY